MSKWEMVKLGEVCEIQSGGTPSRNTLSYWENGTIPWVKIGDIKGKFLISTQECITELGLNSSSTKVFSKGTILFTIFATLGEVSILQIEACTNQAIAGISITHKEISIDFLYYYLTSIKTKIIQTGRGVAQNNINLSILKNIEIPVPPLDEQKRITEELDKISGLITKRKYQLEKLDLLVKAKFVEMFGDLGINPFKWELIKLKECCYKSDDIKCGPFGTQLSKSEYQTSGIPLWGIPQINSFFRKKPVEFLSSEKATRLDAYSLIHGDIAMSRKGNVGMCALFTEELQPGIIHSDVLRIRSNTNKVSPYFLMYQLHFSSFVRYQIEGVSSGAIMAGINVTKLKEIGIHLPPIDLQNQFTDYVTKVEQTKTKLQQGLAQLETLYKARMQEYFE